MRRAREQIEDRHLKALYTCFLGLAARQRGIIRSVQAYARSARLLDRECALLDRLT